MNLIYKQRKQLVLFWLAELEEVLGRSAEEIKTKGLSATDFPTGSRLRLTFPDKSEVRFNYAFHIQSEAKGVIAVFTEHCGYHVFPSNGTIVSFSK